MIASLSPTATCSIRSSAEKPRVQPTPSTSRNMAEVRSLAWSGSFQGVRRVPKAPNRLR